jgi:hypothetical protein
MPLYGMSYSASQRYVASVTIDIPARLSCAPAVSWCGARWPHSLPIRDSPTHRTAPSNSSRRQHHCRFDSTFLQPARHPMKVRCETTKLSYGFCIPVRRYCHVVFCTAYVNPRRTQIQWRKSFGSIGSRRSILLSLSRLDGHIVGLPKVNLTDSARLRIGLRNSPAGRSNWPKPADATKSLIATNRSHTRKRAPAAPK